MRRLRRLCEHIDVAITSTLPYDSRKHTSAMRDVVSSKRTVIASGFLIMGIVVAEYAVHNQDIKGLAKMQGLRKMQTAPRSTF